MVLNVTAVIADLQNDINRGISGHKLIQVRKHHLLGSLVGVFCTRSGAFSSGGLVAGVAYGFGYRGLRD